MTDTLQGRRVPDGEFLSMQSDGLIRPGDYGFVSFTNAPPKWFNCTPDGEIGYLASEAEPDRHGCHHVVTEHEDGSISVGGSILGRVVHSEHVGGVGPISSRGGWHGWLERGVWRSL